MIQPLTTKDERQAVVKAIYERPADDTIHEGHDLPAELLTRLVNDAATLAMVLNDVPMEWGPR